MLRNLSIRAKLLALLAVPLVLLLGVATVLNTQIYLSGRDVRSLAVFGAGADTLNETMNTYQEERLLSVRYLLDPSQELHDQLVAARTRTDVSTQASKQVMADSGLAERESRTQAAMGQVSVMVLQQLPVLRAAVDAQQMSAYQVMTRYNSFSEGLSNLPFAVANDSEDRDLADELRNFGYIARVADAVTQEEVAGLLVIRGIDAELAADARRNAVYKQQQYSGLFISGSSEEEAGELESALADHAAEQSDLAAARKIFNGVAGVGGQVDPEQWIAAATAIADVYRTKSTDTATELVDTANERAAGALLSTVVFTVLNVLVVGGVIILALRFGRGIARRLSLLAAAATEVRDELPRMVERMQTPGEGPGVEIVPLDDASADEVGQLSRVIDDLNSTTVRIAGEQAALRASIAEMFVNVARRDQTLLARQLAFLDQLERTEEDPDTLEDLFTLDHLATRMRRNAESLLVLAGINTGRRLRRPLPLSDVIRTAAGEIEHYDRVDLGLQVDPPVVGHLALSLAHMIAELLENATNFSDPSSRVVVGTAETATGVQVRITDTGLGMNAEELAQVAERIRGAKASEVVGAQRLGFFVVGRLAGRLEVDVHITSEEGKGTTVVLDLAPALFAPGTVGSAAPELDAPAPAAPRADAPIALPPTPVVLSVPTSGPAPEVVVESRPGSAPLPTRTPLPTRNRDAAPAATEGPRARSLPDTPVMPAVDVPLPTETGWSPESVPVAADAPKAMPRRRKAEPAATEPAAAQDILPKRGGSRPRPRRESPVPPRTAAEALWTTRSRAQAPDAH
ncbi:sensor histidine kinase, partial [Kineococcus glutinatus]|uniref:sensor histidine kinase n=1 Tax=Kineococcus glutinatus TaxID=1070872 RepID=UPI0031EF803E